MQAVDLDGGERENLDNLQSEGRLQIGESRIAAGETLDLGTARQRRRGLEQRPDGRAFKALGGDHFET